MMNRLHRIIHAIDYFVMVRIIMPVAHWIDWRFHRNQFDVAAWCITMAIVLLAVDATWHVIYSFFFSKLASTFCLLVNSYLYSGWLKKFDAASRAQENSPGKFFIEHHYWILMPCFMRIFVVVLGIMVEYISIMAALEGGMRTLMMGITGLWFFFISLALYFAGSLPSTRDRRKKPERLPTLAPAGA